MTRTFFLTLLLAISTFSFAQNVDFPDSTATWYGQVEASCSDGPESTYFAIDCYYYYMEGDTVFDSVQYNQVIYPDIGQIVGVRSDSLNRVYVYLPDSSREYLLYDFNISAGDTTFITFPHNNVNPDTMNVAVVKVDTVNLYGAFRRVITVNINLDGYLVDWIEGVGSSEGLLYGNANFYQKSNTCALFCDLLRGFSYGVNDTQFQCQHICLDVGIEELRTIRLTPYIYPTLVSASSPVIISWKQPTTFLVGIFSITGEQLFEKYFQNRRRVKIFPHIKKSGIYLVNVTTEEGTYTTKIIKQ